MGEWEGGRVGGSEKGKEGGREGGREGYSIFVRVHLIWAHFLLSSLLPPPSFSLL